MEGFVMHLRDMKYNLALLVGELEDQAVTMTRAGEMDRWAVLHAQIKMVDATRSFACAVVCEKTRTLTAPQVGQITGILAAVGLKLPS